MRTTMTPDFIFISLSSHDTIKFANLPSPLLLDDLRKTLLPWWVHGIQKKAEEGNVWSIKLLGGDVWSAGGEHGIEARRLISVIFRFLAQEGFGYLTSADMGHPLKAPRMIFTTIPRDARPEYFMISFSLNRRTVTIIDCPPDLAELLGDALRATPRPRASSYATTPQVPASAGWAGEGVYEVVTGDRGAARQDLATLMGGVLKLIDAAGYRFEASVPFGKAGFLGFRGRREVWMFRRTAPPVPLKTGRPRYRD